MKHTTGIKKKTEVARSGEAARDAMSEEFIDGRSEVDLAKLRNCKNIEELVAVSKEMGIELSDELLDMVSGGVNWPDCPNYRPGQDAPIPEALSNNPRVVHLIRSNVTL